MQVTARLKNLQVTPRKTRLVARSIVGMSVAAADIELSRQVRKSSEPMRKLLASAISNAEHDFGLDRGNLYVASIQVGDGMRLKRYKPRAFGRAAGIVRRFCHVTLVVGEVVEGSARGSATKPEKKERRTEQSSGTAKKPADPSLLLSEERKEAKKGASLRQEAKDRRNTVKRVYQRKSF